MWDRLMAIVEEQGQVLMRAAFSPIVRECGDISAGVFNLTGEMLAQAVTGTLTVVRPSLTTYVAGFACDGDPPNASANAGAGSIAANSLTSAVTASGELCLLSSELTTTVFDTTGWWI